MSDVPFPMRIALIVCCSRIHGIAIMSGTFVCLLHAQSTRTEYSSQESLDVQTVFLDDVVPVAILYYVVVNMINIPNVQPIVNAGSTKSYCKVYSRQSLADLYSSEKLPRT